MGDGTADGAGEKEGHEGAASPEQLKLRPNTPDHEEVEDEVGEAGVEEGIGEGR